MNGLCQCGCGQPAPIATITKNKIGQRKGEPMRYVANHQPRPGRTPRPVAEALADYVEPAGATACWPWKGATSTAGYGVISVDGRQKKAHRLAYEAAKGAIPVGLVVRHACDNPPCCNPDHLLLGTHRDNSDDKIRRRRHQFGERSYQARLTERAVLEIRARYAAGDAGFAAMAREYGVGESTIAHAAKGHTWKHVEDVAS